MNSEEALGYTLEFARKKGCKHFDVLVGESNSLGIDLYESKPKNIEYSTNRGLGVRLFHNNCPGYAFTERYSKNSIEQVVQDALSHCAMTGPLYVDLPGPAELKNVDLKQWEPNLEKLTLDELKSAGLEIETVAREAHPSIENIPYLGLARTSGQSWIANSEGLRYSNRSNSLYAGLGVVARSGEMKKMGVYSNEIGNLEDLVPSFFAHRAVARAIELLNPKPVSSGKLPVVLSNRIAGKLMAMYASPYYAEVAQRGQSRLKDKVGERVASNLINLTCEPHIPGWPGSRLFDGEGVPTSTTPIITSGILKTFLYNLEAAKKEKRKSTGHASRGYSGQVHTSFSNFKIELGKSSLHDLLNAHPECLYIVSLEGGSGCSAVSGEMSIGVQGFYVSNGQIQHPVDGITMSGNFFDFMQKIEGVGNQYNDQVSSVKVPDILIGSLDIAG